MNACKIIAILVLALTPMLARAQTLESEVVSVRLVPATVKVVAGEDVRVVLHATISDRWHINSNTPNEEFLIPTTVTAKAKGVSVATVKYPKPLEIKLSFAEKPVSAYEGIVYFPLVIHVDHSTPPGKRDVQIVLDYQACDDKTCMPPTSITTILVVEILPAAPVKESGPEQAARAPNTVADTASGGPPKTSEGSPKTTVPPSEDPTASQSNETSTGVLVSLLFAFIGGMILNLMPCVLPVLSLKIMGMVQQAGEAPRERFKHGMVFALGVVVSFWILSGVLLLLRAGGEQLGWGFQLQSPSFVIVLSVFLFMFGLSMLGVFEIGTSLTSVGQGVATRSAYAGSFLGGVLATIVATPCTAPFMGSALGFALGQPAHVAMLIFTFLGLGMAAPYVVLTTSPRLLKMIPKPGAWMETMKHVMGFFLMTTVLWLLWVLSLQTGTEGVLVLLTSLLLVGIGSWVLGRWGNITRDTVPRRIAQAIAMICIAGALTFSLANVKLASPATAGTHAQGKIEWIKYAPDLVQGLRDEGKPVFIDFTAAWCLSCQVNERVAFSSDAVQEAFVRKGIVTVKADWTNRDSVIAGALASFGRNSVPLYVLYPPRKEAVLLPEILTPGIVLEALEGVSGE